MTTLAIGVRKSGQPGAFALTGGRSREFVSAGETIDVPSIVHGYAGAPSQPLPLRDVGDAKWLRPTVEAMVDLLLRSSAPEWEFGKIRVSTMEAMLSVLATTLEIQTPPPFIVPTWEGGLQAEWHRNGVDLEIETPPNGTPEYYFRSESEEVENPVWDDLARLIRCVKELR